MKRRLGIMAIAGVSALMFAAAFAQEYQEALPDDASVQKGLKKAAAVVPVARPKAATIKAQHAANSDSQVAVLMSKVLQLNKDVGVYQQNAMQRIDNLKQSELQLQQNLQKLQQLMQQFDQQVRALQVQQAQMHQSDAAKPATDWFGSVEQSLGMVGLYAGLAAVLCLLLLLVWRMRPRPIERKAADEPVDSEYDFMSTNEAIPAKLDLARAYMAMEDFDSARGVVAEVFAKGSSTHRQQAQALLDEMASIQQGDQAHGA